MKKYFNGKCKDCHMLKPRWDYFICLLGGIRELNNKCNILKWENKNGPRIPNK
jgi:hypothetical protein